ncbi:hypothetical protein LINGRAHAP2_LOCUS15195 [Linum grandiflorum]
MMNDCRIFEIKEEIEMTVGDPSQDIKKRLGIGGD